MFYIEDVKPKRHQEGHVRHGINRVHTRILNLSLEVMELGVPTITAETATKESPLFGAIPLIQIKDGKSVSLWKIVLPCLHISFVRLVPYVEIVVNWEQVKHSTRLLLSNVIVFVDLCQTALGFNSTQKKGIVKWERLGVRGHKRLILAWMLTGRRDMFRWIVSLVRGHLTINLQNQKASAKNGKHQWYKASQTEYTLLKNATKNALLKKHKLVKTLPWQEVQLLRENAHFTTLNAPTLTVKYMTCIQHQPKCILQKTWKFALIFKLIAMMLLREMLVAQ